MKNRVFAYFILIISLITSCATDTQQEAEVISSKEILPQAERQYDYVEDSVKTDTFQLSKRTEKILKRASSIRLDSTEKLKKNNQLFMPNRLGYVDKEEIYLFKDSNYFQYLTWTFEDSTKTMNAFYNWLDCFGTKCESLRINEIKNVQKNSFVIWVNQQTIHYIESLKTVNRIDWEKILFENNDLGWYYVIHQAKQGAVYWQTSGQDKAKKTVISNESTVFLFFKSDF
ncbi:hypothetical protein CW751_07500 [Brumimicrobium salinarum]|uniref:Lipoprotein n=1 Tax=Brumimicrobium salinarum TaxID=2058658 RepID=A0A2I0R361_9FLAO|nr:hypothetical protein [Brumimicrobium salinarum]PKR81003.1 hypothetical protein CW751_07500 [Brumimicrobium salinarum]